MEKKDVFSILAKTGFCREKLFFASTWQKKNNNQQYFLQLQSKSEILF